MSTLYERLGGDDAIATVVDDFYDRMLDDDRVRHYFDDVDMERQRRHQTLFLASVAGGTDAYDGADMATAHEDLGITDREFGIVAEHLDAALADAGVDEADREAVLSEVAALKPAIVSA
ncbi:group I truncated hemoglobin [Halobaculum litoreum]|uniref:Group 1 truncated hemoglobin n=1 Tax=Halobaculum litoreum TaxID=3031998 RepID=A0ABD5XQP0_9EURY|nr:group 1 truncated hemoglobin [Halobaculum sp. DT92]